MTQQRAKKIYQGLTSLRLDKVVTQLFPELMLTRSQAERLISEGHVTVNDEKPSKAGFSVKPKSTIEVEYHPPEPSELIPIDIPLDILFEDQHLIVINKPSGIAMHPGAGVKRATIVHALLHHIGSGLREVGDVQRPGIVHRLDRDTTGVIVIAKTVEMHASLAKQFERRTIDRNYRALVFTTPRSKRPVRQKEEGEIETQIGRNPVDRKKMSVLKEGGRTAITHWKVIERMSYAALLTVSLRTGRTHQIRVHMEHIGSPVIGDQVYGDFSALPDPLKELATKFGRQALHAQTLAFTHPRTSKRLSFDAAPPADFTELEESFRRYQL